MKEGSHIIVLINKEEMEEGRFNIAALDCGYLIVSNHRHGNYYKILFLPYK
jgi:hypothetical protein